MRLRVVCGFGEIMASFSPTSALSSVDLPALGRPRMQAKPERKGMITIALRWHPAGRPDHIRPQLGTEPGIKGSRPDSGATELYQFQLPRLDCGNSHAFHPA